MCNAHRQQVAHVLQTIGVQAVRWACEDAQHFKRVVWAGRALLRKPEGALDALRVEHDPAQPRVAITGVARPNICTSCSMSVGSQRKKTSSTSDTSMPRESTSVVTITSSSADLAAKALSTRVRSSVSWSE
jgi:hypothetical protein